MTTGFTEARDEHGRLYCTTCGSNCGQCGETGRYTGRSPDGGTMMDHLVANLMTKEPETRKVVDQRKLRNPYKATIALCVLCLVFWAAVLFGGFV